MTCITYKTYIVNTIHDFNVNTKIQPTQTKFKEEYWNQHVRPSVSLSSCFICTAAVQERAYYGIIVSVCLCDMFMLGHGLRDWCVDFSEKLYTLFSPYRIVHLIFSSRLNNFSLFYRGFFPQHYELSHFVSNIEMIYSLRDYCFCLGEEWNHCVHLHVVRPFLWETSAWIFLKICTLFSVSYNLYSNKTRIVLKFTSFSSSAVYNISDMLLYE